MEQQQQQQQQQQRQQQQPQGIGGGGTAPLQGLVVPTFTTASAKPQFALPQRGAVLQDLRAKDLLGDQRTLARADADAIDGAVARGLVALQATGQWPTESHGPPSPSSLSKSRRNRGVRPAIRQPR